MSEKFEVTWEVEDGYIGKSRPQRFHISEDDFDISEDATEEEIEEDAGILFDDMLQQEFENNIYPSSDKREDFIEWVKNIIKG